MLKAAKYELKPTTEQQVLIAKTCGCCRLVYNTMLAQKKRLYEESKQSISCNELIKQLPTMKAEKEFLAEVPSQSLQQAIRHMDTGFQNFFRNRGFGYPKFKKKGCKDSFSIPVPCKVDFDKWTVVIAKIGTVQIYRGRYKEINGTIKSYSVSKTPTDRYYISILYETDGRKPLNNGKSVGIDVGIKTFATLSTGEVFENQKHLKQSLKELRRLQRSCSRKYQSGKKRDEQSNNWKKAMFKVAKLHEKIRFQRHDYLHKVSTAIARRYSTVCVETLSIKNMEQNHRLAQAISDCGWGEFISMLEYKCDNLVKVDRWLASSQTCSDCGYVNTVVKDLRVREWRCPKCGVLHNRDVNAAMNILAAGVGIKTERPAGVSDVPPYGRKVSGCATLAQTN